MLVALEEALAFVDGAEKDGQAAAVLITFDDGYLDSYEIAFPSCARMEPRGFLPLRRPGWD